MLESSTQATDFAETEDFNAPSVAQEARAPALEELDIGTVQLVCRVRALRPSFSTGGIFGSKERPHEYATRNPSGTVF